MSDRSRALEYASPRERIYIGSRVSVVGVLAAIVGVPLFGVGLILFVHVVSRFLRSADSGHDWGPDQYVFYVEREVSYFSVAMIAAGATLLLMAVRRIRQKLRRFGQLAAYRYNPPLHSEDRSHGIERR